MGGPNGASRTEGSRSVERSGTTEAVVEVLAAAGSNGASRIVSNANALRQEREKRRTPARSYLPKTPPTETSPPTTTSALLLASSTLRRHRRNNPPILIPQARPIMNIKMKMIRALVRTAVAGKSAPSMLIRDSLTKLCGHREHLVHDR